MSRKPGFKLTYEHKRKIAASMREHIRTNEHRQNIAKAKLGAKNGMWRGENASYQAKHTWVRSHFKKTDQCGHCGKTLRTDWANISGSYTRTRSDWVELCRSCHMKWDGNTNNFNKELP